MSSFDYWSTVPLGNLVKNKDSQRLPIKESERTERQGSYPYYGASGIIDYVDQYIFEGTHLLVGEDGANLLARSTPIAFIADGKFWVNNHAHVLGATERIDLKYLVYFFETIDLKPYVTGSAQPKLTRKNLDRIPVPLPPLEEQRRIAAILDKADAVRRKRKEAIALTEELLRSAFLDMFGNLVSNIDGNARCHTKGWTKCKLGDQLTLQRGFDITQQQCQEGIYPVISSGGVSAYHSEYKALGPGVLLGRKGSVGRVHYVDKNYWPHDTTLWVKDFKGNHPLFVYYFFKLFPIAHYEASTSNPTLNRNRLHPVDVLWPPHDLQKHFAAVSESVSKCKKNKELAVSESNNFFNSLLQRAFRGEL